MRPSHRVLVIVLTAAGCASTVPPEHPRSMDDGVGAATKHDLVLSRAEVDARVAAGTLRPAALVQVATVELSGTPTDDPVGRAVRAGQLVLARCEPSGYATEAWQDDAKQIFLERRQEAPLVAPDGGPTPSTRCFETTYALAAGTRVVGQLRVTP
jgi:hypothetical protein